MAILFNYVDGAQLSFPPPFSPPYHLVGVSDALFLLIREQVLREIGGEPTLSRLNLRRMSELMRKAGLAHKIIVDSRQDPLFLQVNVIRIDVKKGDIDVLLHLPFMGSAKDVASLIREVRKEVGLPGGLVCSDRGCIRMFFRLHDRNRPVKVRSRKSDPVGLDGSYHMTLEEFENSDRKRR